MEKSSQNDLFDRPTENSEAKPESKSPNATPLAHRARPTTLDDFFGQEHLFERYTFLQEADIPSLILWGPPGTGKTTLAMILAERSGREFFRFNAVLGGVNDLKKLIARAAEVKEWFQKESLIFIDEIHRFNKAQQDALLPYVEEGAFTLIGATTENPRSSVNRALLSRLHVLELKSFDSNQLEQILSNVNQKFELNLDQKTLHFICDKSGGDARKALNILDMVEKTPEDKRELKLIQRIILENAREYDKNQDRHYDVVSAFIKSMRGSDPDAALLWLAVMIDGGEDPVFIARRLVIFASEDIGNADPSALPLAVAALTTVSQIGMPEARISLAQATTYLASTVKSNASYKAIDAALDFVRDNPTLEVPNHLRNQHLEKKNYQYPHNFPHHYVEQDYAGRKLPQFYQPTEMGREKLLKDRLESLKNC